MEVESGDDESFSSSPSSASGTHDDPENLSEFYRDTEPANVRFRITLLPEGMQPMSTWRNDEQDTVLNLKLLAAKKRRLMYQREMINEKLVQLKETGCCPLCDRPFDRNQLRDHRAELEEQKQRINDQLDQTVREIDDARQSSANHADHSHPTSV